MGLEDGEDAIGAKRLCRLEGGAHLSRVMRVVVEDPRTGCGEATRLEAPPGAAEASEAGGCLRDRNAGRLGGGEGGQGVENVVLARDAQLHGHAQFVEDAPASLGG